MKKAEVMLNPEEKETRRQKYSFIGKAIYWFRKQKGWSQSRLAAIAQLTQAQLSDYENGKTLPTSDMLFEICDALEIDPVEFTAKSLEIKKMLEVPMEAEELV